MLPSATVGKISYQTTKMVHYCWVCQDPTDDQSIQCVECRKWSHAKCIGFNKNVLQGLEKAKNALVRVSCTVCGTAENELKLLMTDMVNAMKVKRDEGRVERNERRNKDIDK